MDFDTRIKLMIYRHFAETGCRPAVGKVAESTCLQAHRFFGPKHDDKAMR